MSRVGLVGDPRLPLLPDDPDHPVEDAKLLDIAVVKAEGAHVLKEEGLVDRTADLQQARGVAREAEVVAVDDGADVPLRVVERGGRALAPDKAYLLELVRQVCLPERRGVSEAINR